MPSLNESILLSIECPTCLQYMKFPIYVCVTGHSVCHDCWKVLDSCSICRKRLSDTRNYSLEAITEFLNYSCQNSEFGCKESLSLNEIDAHLATCNFRMYKCKIESCQWEGRRTSIEDHFLNSHAGDVIIGPENLCWWNKSKHTIYLMLAHKEIFYVHMKIVKNYMHWVVQYIGKSEDAVHYYFQINIINSNEFQKNRKVTICENCCDDLKEDITGIIDSGYAASIPVSGLETYRNGNGQVWYSISIEKT